MDDTRLDGNAFGGPLGAALGRDVTAAMGRCAGCGRTGPLAETVVYERAAGLVARCPGCETVLVTLVEARDRLLLAMPGLSFLDLPSPSERTLPAPG